MALENTHYGAEEIGRMLVGCRALFFIGIGGISMASLAEISLLEGYRVGGSDRNYNAQAKRLSSLGAQVFTGHDAMHVEGYDAVIYTVAIGEDNPEYNRARQMGIPIISRADYLGYLMMRFQTRIGISGMHGKRTCTAMCAQIFMEAADPTVLCGAELSSLGGSTCRIGTSREHFVFDKQINSISLPHFNPGQWPFPFNPPSGYLSARIFTDGEEPSAVIYSDNAGTLDGSQDAVFTFTNFIVPYHYTYIQFAVVPNKTTIPVLPAGTGCLTFIAKVISF